MNVELPPWTRTLVLVVGVMDAGTGASLLAAPGWALRQMGIAPLGNEALQFVRFVGVFVGLVGASYLLAWWRGNQIHLRVVLEFTLLFRTGAGLFTGLMVVAGNWAPAWLAVTAIDLGLALLQGMLLRKCGHE